MDSGMVRKGSLPACWRWWPWPTWMLASAVAISVFVGAIIGGIGALYGSGLLLGLLLAYGVLRSLRLGLVVLVGVVFLLPFAALPIDIGFSPTLLDLILLGAYFVWVSQLVSHREGRFLAPSPAVGVVVFALLAIAAFVAGLGHAPLTANVVRRFAELLLGILFFFVVVNAARQVSDLRWLAIAIVAFGTVESVIGIALYVVPATTAIRLLSLLRVVRYPSGSAVLRYIEDNPDLSLRAVATSIDPNVLGGALVFSTTIAIAMLMSRRSLLPRTLLGVSAGLMAICIVLTFSRGSFAGLAAALVALALLRYRRLIWIGMAGLILLAVLPPAQVYVQHFVEGLRGQDLATQMRFGEYKDALILISRHPWLGVGFSGTPEIDTYLGVSNVYLLVAEEMGVFGVIAFAGTLVAALASFLGARRYVAADSPLEPLLYGSSVAVFGGMVGGLVDHYLFNLSFPHATVLLWFTVGMSAAAVRLVLGGDTELSVSA